MGYEVKEMKVILYDGKGEEIGRTGGTYRYGPTDKDQFRGYLLKLRGMLRRGYFTGAEEAEFDWAGDVRKVKVK